MTALPGPKQTEDPDSMFLCWPNVSDAGPMLVQHKLNASCVSGRQWYEQAE